MMKPPVPDAVLLADQVRWVMGRGLPAQDAEDLVVVAWEKASAAWDPGRGPFPALLRTVVRNDAAYWWRTHARRERALGELRLVREPADGRAAEVAAVRQEALLDALAPEERRVFHAWALQKHLGRSTLPAETAGRSVGMDAKTFENAKRRLKDRLVRVLGQLGFSARDVLYGDDDVERTG